MSAPVDGLFYDLVAESELEYAIELEKEGFPPDEAASLETFRYRQSHAGDLFLGAYTPNPRRLIAYICATRSTDPTLTPASFHTHVPAGPTACVHSLCVAPAHRRRGVALALVREHATRLARLRPPCERVLLLAHAELRALYERAGFECVGPSAVVHGARPWLEMRRVLGPPGEAPQMPAGLWEALQRPARGRPAARLFGTFASGAHDLVAADTLKNRFDLLCPRSECGSVILKQGAASWVERASVQLEPPHHPPHPLLPPLPSPPEAAQWWLVTSMMAFENIGFTHPIAQTDSRAGQRVKLLACAECDLGPLGWCAEGQNEFWLACERVGYRDQ